MTIFWLTNVCLEKGFIYENDRIVATKTEICHLKIEGGKITEITNKIPNTKVKQHDANGKLLLPSLRDMHIHIDKTYYGGPWKACTPITKGIFTRLEEEKELLPKLLPTAQERAEKMIELFIKNGHTHIRTHCNVDPVIGLKNLEVTVNALKKYEDVLTYEIVAFPQHGLLKSDSVQLIRDAMKNGATLVGGVDPATVDRNIEKSLNTIFDIAVENNKGVDIHLHDPNTLGAFTFERMAYYTKESGLKGRATISHGIALGDLDGEELNEITAILKEQEMDVTTTVPINRATIPIPTLDKLGIQVSVGHDSITDHWSPFGTGNSIQKLGVLAERFRMSDEYSLSTTLKYGTGGVTPLNEKGERVWPKVGDDATMMLVKATCSAEAVARRAPVEALFFKGKKVESKLEDTDLVRV
ncbi:amidohydrolase family protein [Bacillus sp. ISL-40]|uniref:amidohydrolase family protein n=1 Tax=unclassified Bacillus (in: firmicutes) TaxID=185979 RepID=UPI001BEABC10|nr:MULTISPECIES: amidohydrolase family protein [unclassified Bacillus (in: firmicutes)]MBT2699915.1 amidohydrolase family protein [Bacillus sp. ISL-40]MBT2722934.1 amidohydrolase family protein [Bacillus sp. ISL-46]MBT2743780.1 amidohydrolase family protein [Bacillus sp. ISL-77]